MSDFLTQFTARLAVMVPVLVLVAALSWYALKRLGYLTNGTFSAADMRTWPLRFAMADALIFGVIFAAIHAGLGDSELTAAVAGAASAIVAIGIAPKLAERILS